MIITKSGITVKGYVHTGRGLVEMDDLTPDERLRASTEIKLTWLNALYRGRAVFSAENKQCESAETAR